MAFRGVLSFSSQSFAESLSAIPSSKGGVGDFALVPDGGAIHVEFIIPRKTETSGFDNYAIKMFWILLKFFERRIEIKPRLHVKNFGYPFSERGR